MLRSCLKLQIGQATSCSAVVSLSLYEIVGGSDRGIGDTDLIFVDGKWNKWLEWYYIFGTRDKKFYVTYYEADCEERPISL